MKLKKIISFFINEYNFEQDIEGNFYFGKNYIESPDFVTTVRINLTNKQKQYLDKYNEFYNKNMRYPTYKEIGDIMGVVPSVSFEAIKKIKNKGYIM